MCRFSVLFLSPQAAMMPKILMESLSRPEAVAQWLQALTALPKVMSLNPINCNDFWAFFDG